MNIYTNIINETHIEKTEFSEVLGSVYDVLLSYNEGAEKDFIEMELILALLEQQRKVVKYLLYNNKLTTRKQRGDAIGFLSKVDFLREAYDIAQGKTSIEELEKAAKTFAPKMQSSFEK